MSSGFIQNIQRIAQRILAGETDDEDDDDEEIPPSDDESNVDEHEVQELAAAITDSDNIDDERARDEEVARSRELAAAMADSDNIDDIDDDEREREEEVAREAEEVSEEAVREDVREDVKRIAQKMLSDEKDDNVEEEPDIATPVDWNNPPILPHESRAFRIVRPAEGTPVQLDENGNPIQLPRLTPDGEIQDKAYMDLNEQAWVDFVNHNDLVEQRQKKAKYIKEIFEKRGITKTNFPNTSHYLTRCLSEAWNMFTASLHKVKEQCGDLNQPIKYTNTQSLLKRQQDLWNEFTWTMALKDIISEIWEENDYGSDKLIDITYDQTKAFVDANWKPVRNRLREYMELLALKQKHPTLTNDEINQLRMGDEIVDHVLGRPETMGYADKQAVLAQLQTNAPPEIATGMNEGRAIQITRALNEIIQKHGPKNESGQPYKFPSYMFAWSDKIPKEILTSDQAKRINIIVPLVIDNTHGVVAISERVKGKQLPAIYDEYNKTVPHTIAISLTQWENKPGAPYSIAIIDPSHFLRYTKDAGHKEDELKVGDENISVLDYIKRVLQQPPATNSDESYSKNREENYKNFIEYIAKHPLRDARKKESPTYTQRGACTLNSILISWYLAANALTRDSRVYDYHWRWDIPDIDSYGKLKPRMIPERVYVRDVAPIVKLFNGILQFRPERGSLITQNQIVPPRKEGEDESTYRKRKYKQLEKQNAVSAKQYSLREHQHKPTPEESDEEEKPKYRKPKHKKHKPDPQ